MRERFFPLISSINAFANDTDSESKLPDYKLQTSEGQNEQSGMRVSLAVTLPVATDWLPHFSWEKYLNEQKPEL